MNTDTAPTEQRIDPVLDPLLDALFERGATDLIISAGAPPSLRIDGHLLPMTGSAPVSADQTAALADALLNDELRRVLARKGAADLSFAWGTDGRIRGNVFRQRGTIALALRAIPRRIPGFAELRLPSVVSRLVELPKGLVLMTGPTGAGKSTTQASMLDWINRSRPYHILTIEDPVEYVHQNVRSVIEQREVGIDTPSFAEALRAALREDPDVLLVGEMRDLESIRMALTIAETGHLVFATLHTNDTPQAIDRIVDVFPGEQQQQIRVQLAAALQAIMYQQLVPKRDGGLVAAFEVVTATHAVRNLIRENRTGQIRNVISTSRRDGMHTLEASLNELIAEGLVDFDEAVTRSLHPGELRACAELAAPAADWRRVALG